MTGASTSTPAIEERMLEMAHKFDECLMLGEQQAQRDGEDLARLRLENRTLRQLLRTSAKNTPELSTMFSKLLRFVLVQIWHVQHTLCLQRTTQHEIVQRHTR
jgi:hypothetical protein